MTKTEVVNALAKRTGMPRKDAAEAVEIFLESILEALLRGEKVSLVGFGTFYVREKISRQDRNPRSGLKIQISERRVQAPGDRLRSRVQDLTGTAERFIQDFEDPIARINRHTNLCHASRSLRETARANRNTPFYWALVDIDDCVRACPPEEMTLAMAHTLQESIAQLSPGMSEEAMLGITDDLFNAGLRTWSAKKRRPRKKSKSRS